MKKLFHVLIVIASFFVLNNVNAKELNTNKKIAKAEEEVEVSFRLEGDKVTLQYDPNVFEEINKFSFDVDSREISNEGNTFYITEETEESIKVTLKVKENVVAKDTTIKAIHDGVEDEVDIEIDGKEQNSFFWLLPGGFALGIALFMLGFYLNTKDNFESRELITMVVSGILVVILVVTAITLKNKKEDPTDDTVEYWIELRDEVNDETNEEANDNEEKKDEVVSQEVEKETNKPTQPEKTTPSNQSQPKEEIVYRANIDSYLTSTAIAQKGENILVSFQVEVTPSAKVTAVEINGTVYPVTQTDDKYQVTIKAENRSGNYDYTITSVFLADGTKISVDNKTANIYILKEKPVIEEVTVDNKEEVPVLRFNVQDSEDAFVSGTIIVTVKDNATANSETEILNVNTVKVGQNEYAIPNLKDDMNYNVVITLNYDLDEDKTDAKYSDQLEKEETGNFEREYNFSLEEVRYPEKVTEDDVLTFSFKNGSYAYSDVTSVTIDGKTYTVTKTEDGLYTLDGATGIVKNTPKGKKEFTVESVTFTKENGKEKKVEVNQSFEYLYLKNEPSVNNFSAILSGESVLSGTVNLLDEDNTIVSGKVILTKKDKTYEYDLTKEQLASGSFHVNVELEKAGDYEVTLALVYNLGEDESTITATEKPVITKSLEIEIEPIDVPEVATKNSSITLTYKIKDNTDEKISQIEINGNPVEVTDNVDDTYTVSIKVGNQVGDYKIATTAVVYEEELARQTVTVDEKTVYVLKEKPILTEEPIYKLNDKIVTIKLSDADHARVDETSKMIFTEVTSQSVTEIPILFDLFDETGGMGIVDISKLENGTYNVKVEVAYDLDGPTLDLEPYQGYVGGEYENVSIITNYDSIKVTELTLDQFIEDNEKIQLKFTISNDTEATVTKVKINGKIYEISSVDGNNYTVVIDNPKTRTELKIEELTLSTGVTKQETGMNTILVNKLAPEATVSLNIAKEKEQNITADITITDKDNTITGNVFAILQDENGEELARTEVNTTKESSQPVTVNFETTIEGGNSYQVVVIADYDRVDGNTYKEAQIGLSDIVPIDVTVELDNFYVSSPYAYPNEKYYTLHFDFKSNAKLKEGIQAVKVHMEEYNNELADKDPYVPVNLEAKDSEINNVRCDESVKTEDGYKTTCRVNYVTPDKSSVIYLKPVSYTYLSKETTVSEELANEKKVLVDIVKPVPKFEYHTENVWSQDRSTLESVNIKLKINDTENVLRAFDGQNYVEATLAGRKSSSVITNSNEQQTIEFKDISTLKLNQGYRVMIKVLYNKYHGNIVNPNPKDESNTLTTYIHFITKPNEISLNDIKLMDKEGLDIGNYTFASNDHVKLSFVIDGDVPNHTDKKPKQIKITTNVSNENYPKIYNLEEADGIYTTVEGLTNLTSEQQTLTISELIYGENDSVKTTKDNSIVVTITDSSASVNYTLLKAEENNGVTLNQETNQTWLDTPYYSTSQIIEVAKDVETNDPGVIWWAEFTCDMNRCFGFNEHGSNAKTSKVLEGRRAELTSIVMNAPKVKDGYKFIGWKKYIAKYGELNIQGFEAVYEPINN